MSNKSYVHIRLRRDTASNWTNNNPILKVGEPGLETDTRKLKFGDGITSWNNLQYAIGGNIDQGLLLEDIDDRVFTLIKSGSNISVSYNDNANELTISAIGLQLAGDYAGLVNGKVPSAQLPSYVDDVLEYASLATLPVSGETGKIYVTLDNNKTYRWGGSSYIEIIASPGSTDSIPEGNVNKYYTDTRASAAAPVQSVSGKTGTVTLTKSDVGLDNIDNTSDANKPVSTAQAAADSAVQSAAASDATAKANTAQAFAIQRSNHTGTQAISTVDGLETVLDGKAPTNHNHTANSITDFSTAVSNVFSTGIVAGDGVSLTYNNITNDIVVSTTESRSILSLGSISGTNAISFGTDRLIQTLTLGGTATTFTRGINWPSTNISVEVILRITVTSATSITWTIVNDWFNQPPAGALSVGTHLFLLRAIGPSIIEGHYLGNKTN